MKTSIKTTLATALALVFSVSTAFTTLATERTGEPTVSASKMNVNMVVVTGDVDVYLIHSDKEDIKVISNNTDANVSVKKRGAKLYIQGSKSERVTMYVYLKDLKRIDASNTAYVKTQGDFKLSALQIFLKDTAKANLNVNTESLYTVIKDHSNLKLKGSTTTHDLIKGAYANLKADDFQADSTNKIASKTAYAANK